MSPWQLLTHQAMIGARETAEAVKRENAMRNVHSITAKARVRKQALRDTIIALLESGEKSPSGFYGAIQDWSPVAIRHELKRMVDAGMLKRKEHRAGYRYSLEAV